MLGMAASRHVWRFTAGHDPGPRSSVWRVWTRKDEIYAMTPYAGGVLKTSLHSPRTPGTPGDFRHAFSSEHAALAGSGERVFERWAGPIEEPGFLRLVAEIRMPTDELTVPTAEPSVREKAKITLLEPAPSGRETIVSLFVLRDEEVDSEGKRVTIGPMVLIQNWRLPTRGSLLIFAAHRPIPDDFAPGIATVRRDIAGQVGEPLPPEDGHRRIALFGHSNETSVAGLIDLAAALPAPASAAA